MRCAPTGSNLRNPLAASNLACLCRERPCFPRRFSLLRPVLPSRQSALQEESRPFEEASHLAPAEAPLLDRAAALRPPFRPEVRHQGEGISPPPWHQMPRGLTHPLLALHLG